MNESNEDQPSVFGMPSMDVVVNMPDESFVLIKWLMILPLPRYGEGFHFLGGSYMIEHCCWTFNPETPGAPPSFMIHLVDEDDFDDDRVVQEENGPDIKIGSV